MSRTRTYRILAISGLLLISLVSISAHNPARANSIAETLKQYVGKDRSEVERQFGKATLATDNRLIYEFGNKAPEFGPSPPTVTDDLTRGGSVSTNARWQDSDQLPCHIVVDLDKQGRVTSMSNQGPGCFEIVHGPANP